MTVIMIATQHPTDSNFMPAFEHIVTQTKNIAAVIYQNVALKPYQNY